jgi:transaldolase/glucose-6-phosphate isomerase
MGQNIRAMIGWGLAMLAAAQETPDDSTNPAVALGLAMGTAARSGRDKLTLLVPPALEPFGLWVEQLVAESTGKRGTGIVPITGEPMRKSSEYGADRFFARLRLHGSYEEEMRDAEMRDLKASGVPMAETELLEPAALGAEFVRWEIATAVAGALLGINPFDEPNVQQAKDATRALLEQYQAHGQLPVPTPDAVLDGGIAVTLSRAARLALNGGRPESFLSVMAVNDYFALLAYVGPDAKLRSDLRAFRDAVGSRTKAATMFGYGPRYLHSTGQLHKGGPNTGVFVLLSATPDQDLAIPGEQFSFGTLELAQALGDFASLDAAGRRVLHAHLPAPRPQLVEQVADVLLRASAPRSG